MKKSMKVFEFRVFADNFLSTWENDKKDMKLTGRALFNLIGLKKNVEAQLVKTQETLVALAQQNHGEPDGKGNYNIPEDYRGQMNKDMNDFAEQEIEIEYEEIKLKDSDVVSAEFLDSIYDFVKFED